ncbi:putative BPI/LBP family protein At1g04970 isoform X1 [Pistacia vera]|uniref:putative BPI/LBP family protein At1g04970 isoform X1 n=1 Tax=Pistacia vera TaxID=55513 RepID=UPI0012634FFB|nr:putative BPI/LBP family protein At1g04970 isoform X1 [Pistacia vera]
MGWFSKFSSPAILFIFLSILLVPTRTHLQSSEEGYISVVISNKGLDFVKSVLISKAISSIIPLKLKDIEKSKKIPVVGKVQMVLSNITIYNVNIDTSYAKIGDTGVVLVASGATANLSMNWKYSYGTWLLPIAVSDSGSASVLVEGMEVGVTIALKDQGGMIKLSLLDCGSSVKDISVKLDGGASWLYQGFLFSRVVEAFGGKIRSQVEDAISKKTREEITKLDSLLQSLPKEIPVNDVAAFNVTFVSSPVLRSSSVELEINGLFSASSDTAVPNYDHKRLQASIYCNTAAKMIGIAFHENVFSSAALVYFNANYMHWIVDKVPDESLLNTAGWRYIVPKLYKLYPNDEMNLNLSVTSPPIIKISEHDIDVTVYLDVIINVLDSNEVVPVACISLVISTSCTPKILSNNLIGSIRLIDFTAALKWSNIGNLHMQLVQSVMSTLLKTVFMPYVNLHLLRGFPLPIVRGFSIRNADIFYIDSRVVICSDVAFTEQTEFYQQPIYYS